MRTRKAKDRSRLIQAAMGQIPCDLTIGNVQFFNVITGEIYPASVDILDGFVVLVREEGQKTILPSRSYYDGQGRYLIRNVKTHTAMISCVCCIPVVGQFKGRPVETRGPCDFPAYT